MRCPKCLYISFDNGDRCRNCGYEFSLTVDVTALDLPIQTGNEPLGPLDDFSLADLDRTLASPTSAAVKPAAVASPQAPDAGVPAPPRNTDLPLFKDRSIDADAPLVTPPAVPRPPLAVRRSSPAVPRAPARPIAEEPRLELGPAERPASRRPPPPRVAAPARPEPAVIPAPAARRALAAMIDGAILGTIDVGVLYFTLQLCGITVLEITMIPPVPFFAFLLLLNGGYFVAFTAAGGQTIGKMAAGIKVVPVGPPGARPDGVPLGHAVVRAAAYLISVVPAGLGMLPAFFSADGRAVHDRLAATRVIRA